MTLVRHSLSRDDWDLTRKGLRGQLTQLKLTVGGVEASILHCERMMKRFPPKEDVVRPLSRDEAIRAGLGK